jgi:hypothetical protein
LPTLLACLKAVGCDLNLPGQTAKLRFQV